MNRLISNYFKKNTILQKILFKNNIIWQKPTTTTPQLSSSSFHASNSLRVNEQWIIIYAGHEIGEIDCYRCRIMLLGKDPNPEQGTNYNNISQSKK